MKIFSRPSLQQGFEFEVNVKCVKTGRRKTEGWARKVLRIPRCQQAKRLMRNPGRRKVEMAMAAADRISPSLIRECVTPIETARPLKTSVAPQAKQMRMNCGERSPPRQLFCSGRIRQGPTFRFLPRAREEEMTDVEKATPSNKVFWSSLPIPKMISPPSASRAFAIKNSMISIDGTASQQVSYWTMFRSKWRLFLRPFFGSDQICRMTLQATYCG